MGEKKEVARTYGIIAATLSTVCVIPQVWVLWTRAPHAAPDVPLLMYVPLMSSSVFWMIYGKKNDAKIVLVANCVMFVLALAVVVYKLKFG